MMDARRPMSPATTPFLSYSANNEDVILNRLFGMQESGFFVDVGAAHPRFENDTRALYDRGWRGINIEPTAGFFAELAQDRPEDTNLNVAVSDRIGEIILHEVVGTGLSTCNADEAARAAGKGFEVVQRTVPVTTLRKILADADVPVIDVLKVDVEGLEYEVLTSNDWSSFRPRIVIAECTYPESPVRRENGVTEYLGGHGYRHVYFDGLNDFYAEQSFVVPAGTFDRPPNVFDRFEPLVQHELRIARDGLASQLQKARQEQENAAVHISSLTSELEASRAHVSALEGELGDLRSKHHRALVGLQAHATDLKGAREELIALRERGQALAAQMEAMAMHYLRAEHPPAVSASVAIAASPSRPWNIRRVARALSRPRRTLRILMGRSPE